MIKEETREGNVDGGRVIKRVFETSWSESAVYLMDKVSFSQEQYFKPSPNQPRQGSTLREIIAPDLISYRDLIPFLGKRTKVTIEIEL